jgi:hypothetical protein
MVAAATLMSVSACGQSQADAASAQQESAAAAKKQQEKDKAAKEAAVEEEAAEAAKEKAAEEKKAAEKKSQEQSKAAEKAIKDAQKGTALAALAKLAVKGRAPKTGYSRDQFGPAWSDVDHNGCDTRNDILKRDLKSVTYKAGTHNCTILTGTLNDPYTATAIHFQRGQKTSTKVQIDHVVALSDAWQKGAQNLSGDQRKQLANDPYNLLAVDGSSNMSKSDGDAATWLPRNKGFRCQYVARQIGVKTKYSLWVTSAEKSAMSRVLSSCPSQKVPSGGGASVIPTGNSQQTRTKAQTKSKSTTRTRTQTKTRARTKTQQKTTRRTPVRTKAKTQTKTRTKAKTQPKKKTYSTSGSSTYYKNCTAVRAAGKAPIYKGQPGYSYKLDRDRDGVGCEN